MRAAGEGIRRLGDEKNEAVICKPLLPTVSLLLRLKAQWQGEYRAWKQRRLDNLEVVYIWADGLYVKAGLEDTKAALLVTIGALSNG
jgi:hypothetical protein